MNNNRERLAWLILLVSFALCVALAVGTPLGIRTFLRTARVEQDALLEPQQGRPGLQRRGRGEILALVEPTWDVPAASAVTTDRFAQALLTVHVPRVEGELDTTVTVQIYGDTEVRLISAHSPRFALSPLPHSVVLQVQAGRVRVLVSPVDDRPTKVELRTPHMVAHLEEGSYEVRVGSDASELTVRYGQAEVVSASGETVTLGDSERIGVLAGQALPEALPAERNLLVNGDFREPLSTGWSAYHDEQRLPAGEVEITDLAGRQAARFYRSGLGHAEVGIRQEINYDVRDFTSLVLHMSVQVREQSLPGCGSLGTECPIMVRIDYKDIYGTDRVWYHGFYWRAHVPPDVLYDYEQEVPFQTWATFDSENLVEVFDEPPALIKVMTIYASGHSFDALVAEVELLAEE